MDGYLAPLDEICALADRYDALVMVDDSHAVGFMGPSGAGTPELFGVQDRVDVNTGTLGKALGGASGGYVSGRAEIVELLRQRARPYLFSNAVAPSVVAGSLAALELVTGGGAERAQLHENAALFRRLMTDAGFDLLPGEHPIVPVMFGDAVAGRAGGRGDARARRVRDRVQLPGRAAGQGPHPRPAVGGALERGRRGLRAGVRRRPRGRPGLTSR